MSSENYEATVLICQLLGCHTPSDQNEILENVLSIVAKSRVIDHNEKHQIRNKAENDLSAFSRIVSDGDSRVKSAYEALDRELKDQQSSKANSQ